MNTFDRIISDMRFCLDNPAEFTGRNGFSLTSAMRTVVALNPGVVRDEFVQALGAMGYNTETVARQFRASRKLDQETTTMSTKTHSEDLSFSDLEDPGEWTKQTQVHGKAVEPINDDIAAITLGTGQNEATTARYEESCHKCRGSGLFRGYSGRIVGDCFACKGKGKLYYKTSPETRQARKDYSAKRKAKKATEKAAALASWSDEHATEVAYLKARAGRWNFADSLLENLGKFGSLTPGQLAAVRKCMDKDAEKAAAAKVAPDTGLDLSGVPSGLYAVPDGETRLKLRIARPRKPSNWHGYIFVSDGAEYGSRTNYGRQAPGQSYSGKCIEQLRAVATDPAAAMAAYGHLTGTCGKCGRKLEDEESVARGIGPVCAKKMG